MQNFKGDIFQSYCRGDIYGEGVEIGDDEKDFFPRKLARGSIEKIKSRSVIPKGLLITKANCSFIAVIT